MSGDGSPRFLIAAGTENYANLGDEWGLTSVGSDLDAIESLFTTDVCGYRRVLTHLRMDPANTQLRDGLQRWLTESERSAEDVAVVYYTGHGDVLGDTFYLITANTEADRYSLTAVDVRDIVDFLREGSPLRRLLIMIDACYSGQGAQEIAEAVVRNAKLLNFAARGEGVWVLAAARPRQEARESRFAPALASAVRYWQENTGAAQRYIALETILETVADELGAEQQPYWTVVGVGGLAPFFPNPNFDRTLPVGLDLDTRRRFSIQREFAEHWTVKARGSDLDTEGGWYFSGRRRALEKAAAYLTSPAPATVLQVITGDPGSGKSAVLGRLVLYSERAIPSTSNAALDTVTLPEVRIDAALLVRGKTMTDLRRELTGAMNLSPDVDAVQGIAVRQKSSVIVIDALDEAVDPHQVVSELIDPLVEAGRNRAGAIRLLVGTRRNLLSALPADRDEIDLDHDDYFDTADLARYVEKILLGVGDPDSSSPYRCDPEQGGAVAEKIAGIAGRSFLIAQLTARALAAEPTALTADEVDVSRSHWRNLDVAFASDLERYGDRGDTVRDLLGALAWAEGAGLPRQLWPAIANSFAAADTFYNDADVAWLLEHAAGYIIEAVEEEWAVYRLYHREFADYFRRRRDVQETQRTISDTLLRRVTTGSAGRRNWTGAAPYLRSHLAAHAAAGGGVDALVEDLDFVVWATPRRLLTALFSTTTTWARDLAITYQQCVTTLQWQQPVTRASQLELTAGQLGLGDLARRLADHFSDRPFTTRWVRRESDPGAPLAEFNSRIVAVGTALGGQGPVLVAASSDGDVRCVDAVTGSQFWSVQLGAPIKTAAMSADRSAFIVAIEARAVVGIALADGAELWRVPSGDCTISAVAGINTGASPVLVTGTYNEGLDTKVGAPEVQVCGVVRLWRLDGKPALAWTQPLFGAGVTHLEIADPASGRRILAAGDPFGQPDDQARFVRVLDMDGQLVAEFPPVTGGIMSTATWDNAFSEVLVDTYDSVYRWDPDRGMLTSSPNPRDYPGCAAGIVPFERDGRRHVVLAGWGELCLMDGATLREIGQPGAIRTSATCVTVLDQVGTPALVTGDWAGAIRSWTIDRFFSPSSRDEQLISTAVDDSTAAVFALLNAVSDGVRRVVVLDAATGTERAEFETPAEQLFCDPNASLLLLADFNGVVQARRCDNLDVVWTERVHSDSIADLRVHDGMLVSVGRDHAVRVTSLADGGALCPPTRFPGWEDRGFTHVEVIGPNALVVAAGLYAGLVGWSLTEMLAGDAAWYEDAGDNDVLGHLVADASESVNVLTRLHSAGRELLVCSDTDQPALAVIDIDGRSITDWTGHPAGAEAIVQAGKVVWTGDARGALRAWRSDELAGPSTAAPVLVIRLGSPIRSIHPLAPRGLVVATRAGLTRLDFDDHVTT